MGYLRPDFCHAPAAHRHRPRSPSTWVAFRTTPGGLLEDGGQLNYLAACVRPAGPLQERGARNGLGQNKTLISQRRCVPCPAMMEMMQDDV